MRTARQKRDGQLQELDGLISTSSSRSRTENDDNGTRARSNLAGDITLTLKAGRGIFSKQHALRTERRPISRAYSTTHSLRRAFVVGVGVPSFSLLFK